MISLHMTSIERKMILTGISVDMNRLKANAMAVMTQGGTDDSKLNSICAYVKEIDSLKFLAAKIAALEDIDSGEG